jgi:glycosyltransferase involved in cell wall biosynthesis
MLTRGALIRELKRTTSVRESVLLDFRPGQRKRRLTVLLLTEGTYPYVIGGVSTWCDQLLRNLDDIDWLVVPIVAGGLKRQPCYKLPANARLAGLVDLWGVDRRAQYQPRVPRRPDLAAKLTRALLGWDADPLELLSELVWCHTHPSAILPSFRTKQSWKLFLAALEQAVGEPSPGVTPGVHIDMPTAVSCYQTLSWVARTAATRLPSADVIHVTAAGWAGIPAIVSKQLTGTPILLTEHGVFVREAYLAAARSLEGHGSRLLATRLARAFARAAYLGADLVSPVTEAHCPWEIALGVPPERIRPIPNGVHVEDAMTPPPGRKIVVTVGRIDPLKDVKTLLRVAARVLERHPDVRFLHYGPVSAGQEAYAAACYGLHDQLNLGASFVFNGSTSDPRGAIREGDVALMTSISEGFPMAVLEALSEGRPVVTTTVGGVRDAMKGAGLTAGPRDVEGLTDAVCALVEDPELARTLGARGYARVRRRFSQEAFVASYRQIFSDIAESRSEGLRA